MTTTQADADRTNVVHRAVPSALLANRTVSHFTIDGFRSPSVSNIATACPEQRTIPRDRLQVMGRRDGLSDACRIALSLSAAAPNTASDGVALRYARDFSSAHPDISNSAVISWCLVGAFCWSASPLVPRVSPTRADQSSTHEIRRSRDRASACPGMTIHVALREEQDARTGLAWGK